LAKSEIWNNFREYCHSEEKDQQHPVDSFRSRSIQRSAGTEIQQREKSLIKIPATSSLPTESARDVSYPTPSRLVHVTSREIVEINKPNHTWNISKFALFPTVVTFYYQFAFSSMLCPFHLRHICINYKRFNACINLPSEINLAVILGIQISWKLLLYDNKVHHILIFSKLHLSHYNTIKLVSYFN